MQTFWSTEGHASLMEVRVFVKNFNDFYRKVDLEFFKNIFLFSIYGPFFFILNSDMDLKEQYRLVELKKMLSQYGMRTFQVSYASRAKVS